MSTDNDPIGNRWAALGARIDESAAVEDINA